MTAAILLETVHIDDEDIVFIRGFRDLKRTAMNWPTFTNDVLGRIQIPSEDKTRNFRQYPIEFDPPAHGAWRALVAEMFARPATPAYIARINALVSRMVDGLLASDHTEIVTEFALPLQSMALAVLLDMPDTAGALWASWGMHLLRAGGALSLNRADALVRYLDKTIRAAGGGDTFFDRLTRMQIDGRLLSHDERMGFAHLVFAGGRDTVIRLVSGGIGYLATHPAEFDRLRADPGLAVAATEELVRYISPLALIGRVCTKDTEIGGTKVAAGQRVGLCWANANRDPGIFASADSVDLARQTNPHVGFGSGPHACLGAAHARLLSRSVLAELATRVGVIDLVEAKQATVDSRYDHADLQFDRLVVRMR